MNQSKQIDFTPSEFSTEQLDRFLFALMGRMKFHYPDGVEKPRTKEQIAEYLEVTPRQVDKLVSAGIVKARRTHDGADPRYFASEIKWH